MAKFLTLAIRYFPTICGLLGLVDRNKDGKITPGEVGATLVDLNRDGKVDTVDLAILLTAAAPVAAALGHPAAAALIADAARRLSDPKSAGELVQASGVLVGAWDPAEQERWTISEPPKPLKPNPFSSGILQATREAIARDSEPQGG